MRFPVLVALMAVASTALTPLAECSAQCCGAQPTVAYSPVVAAPVVQATTVSNGWYPGKYLTDFTRGLFGYNRTTTYTTNYAPTPYTAGYAATPYTAGYASPYAVGYAPSPYTAGYAQTAYRPVYPATYGSVAYAPAPLTQTVSRPVVLSPVVSGSACGGCDTGCSACGVEQASYVAPSDCGSCSTGSCGAPAASYAAPPSSSYQGGSSYQEPQPALSPEVSVPPRERSIDARRPEIDDAYEPDTFNDDYNDRTEGDPAAANDYFSAPPLFPPSNRVTQRSTHPAPTRMAVYKRAPATRPTAYRPADLERPAPRGKVNRLSADAWVAGS